MNKSEIGLRVVGLLAATCLPLVLCGCGESGPPGLVADESNYTVIRDEFSSGASSTSGDDQNNPLADPNRTPQWGTIKGTVIMNGDPPARLPLEAAATNKDRAVCAPGGKAPLSDRLVVGQGGGIQNVLIFLNTKIPQDDSGSENPVMVHGMYNYAKVQAGDFPDKLPQQRQVVDFDQKNCVFLSHVFAMRSNQELRILNSDPIGHNTKIDASRARSINAQIEGEKNDIKGSVTYLPENQENAPVPVSCSIHNWMNAWIITRDNPYFAVTNEQGEFEIVNVPAGLDLEFRIWHETTKFISAPVKLNGQPLELKKGGKFLVNIGDGDTKQMDFVIDNTVFPQS